MASIHFKSEQLRRPQGAHDTSDRTTRSRCRNGPVRPGSAGPKIPIVLTPRADAICIGPVSPVTTVFADRNNPPNSFNDVRPVQSISLPPFPVRRLIIRPRPSSSAPPVNITVRSVLSRINPANSAQCSAGQRLDGFAAPMLSAMKSFSAPATLINSPADDRS